MKTFEIIAQSPEAQASQPVNFSLNSAGELTLFSFTTAVIWFFLNKGWEWVQSRQKQTHKQQDSQMSSVEQIVVQSMENKNKLLAQLQEEQKTLLKEVIGNNDEQLKTIQASVTTMLAVQSTLVENVRFYADSTAKQCEQILSAVERIDAVTSRNVSEAFSTQARLYADLRTNQATQRELLLAVHARLDKRYGADQDVQQRESGFKSCEPAQSSAEDD